MKLNRRVLALVLVAALTLTTVTLVSAQGDTLSATVRGFLYLRAVPSVEAPDYGRLEPDAAVTVVGRTADGEWVKVMTEDEVAGWARANALDIDGDYMMLPDMSLADNQGVVVNFAGLRLAPDLGTDATMVNQGTVVTFSAMYEDWIYGTTADGAAGWVWTANNAVAFVYGPPAELPEANATVQGFAFVRALPDIESPTFERLTPATPINAIGKDASGEFVQVETLGGLTGWTNIRGVAFTEAVSLDDLAETAPTEDQAVVANYAVLRESPSFSAAEVATLDAGTVVDVQLVDDGRVFVQAGEVSGWALAGAFVFPAGDASAVLSANATIVAEGVDAVNLRAAPSTEAALRGSVPVGSPVTVIGVSEDGEWYYVVPTARVPAWVFGVLVDLDADDIFIPVLDAEGNPVE